ncbi:DNA-dependent metalloprotease dvc-1 [Amyelois transitella]|uniref:DNA-dependent metalloprotease dvc-1 n=1 Tax=Amyelois transitella TaxID=680683 RepID=UPI00067CFED5|nr:DNA-dependent metalloprotease dvc-1 [Amyelois transitella]
MNLGDPELELIDPTPNIHTLFLHFDKLFFWTKLASRAVVRWSKRMYSCAGICSYEGRGGLCDIALSEPLLKLRPRKDLVETLLHEMIHAYLFITCRDRERDGHGPNFQAHMHRINRSAGLDISIYHDFHDEVKLYLNHWWRCDGPCQKKKPYFGIVRRSQNRAPGPSDSWWNYHQKHCGGTFAKIKEPEKKTNKKQAVVKKNPIEDITKYLNNNNNSNTANKNIKTINDVTNNRNPLTPLLKNPSNIPTAVKSNGGKTVVINPITQKDINYDSNKDNKPLPHFTGKGHTLIGNRQRSSSVDAVAETVRSVWAKKYDNTNSNKKGLSRSNSTIMSNKETKTNKTKPIPVQLDSPASKIRKIDDYFKNAASSVLKDLYGSDFKITQTNNSDKTIVAMPIKNNLVNCPVCNAKIDDKEINRHLDECLNKDVIEKLSKENVNEDVKPTVSSQPRIKLENEIKASNFVLPPLKPKVENFIPKQEANVFSSSNMSIDLTNIAFGDITKIKKEPKVEDVNFTFDPVDVNKVKSIVKKIQFDKHIRKSGDFVTPEEPVTTEVGFLPSFLADKATEIVMPPLKQEPGTSKDMFSVQKCPCCDNEVKKPMAEHLDECLSFFDNNSTIPEEGASTSFANNTIVIDDDEDDIFDETQTMNATGTKTPCPCCLAMVETEDMNTHLDVCLS